MEVRVTHIYVSATVLCTKWSVSNAVLELESQRLGGCGVAEAGRLTPLAALPLREVLLGTGDPHFQTFSGSTA